MAFWNNKHEPTPGPSETGLTSGPLPPPLVLPKHEEPIPMPTIKREEPAGNPAGSTDLLLAQGAEFEGRLTFKGTVRIDAKFKGSIVTNDVLIVGEHARIDAEITCGMIVVHGQVNGNITAKTAIELRYPAKVRGNLETPSLLVEKGVFLEGDIKMENLDKATPVKVVSPSTTAAAQ